MARWPLHIFMSLGSATFEMDQVVRYIREHGDWRLRVHMGLVTAEQLRERIQQMDPDGVMIGVTGNDPPEIGKDDYLGRTMVEIRGGGDLAEYPSVCMDEREMGRLAARHLIAQGVQSLAFVGFDTKFCFHRQEGFAEEAERNSVPCVSVSPNVLSREEMPANRAGQIDLALDWLGESPKPGGLLGATDSVALDAMDRCRERGLAVPHEVAICGVDNHPTSAVAPIGLTSVDRNAGGMIYEAAAVLDRQFTGKSGPLRVVIQPKGVVARESTDLEFRDDPVFSRAIRRFRDRACQPLDVTDILEEIPMSRRTFERRVQEKLGRTPREELRRLRLQRAREMLVDARLSQADIAMACGFQWASALNRAFREEFGVTPGEFRRSRQVRRER